MRLQTLIYCLNNGITHKHSHASKRPFRSKGRGAKQGLRFHCKGWPKHSQEVLPKEADRPSLRNEATSLAPPASAQIMGDDAPESDKKTSPKGGLRLMNWALA